MCYYHIDHKRLAKIRRANRLGITEEELEDLEEIEREEAEERKHPKPEPKPIYITENGVDMVLTDSGVYEPITD